MVNGSFEKGALVLAIRSAMGLHYWIDSGSIWRVIFPWPNSNQFYVEHICTGALDAAFKSQFIFLEDLTQCHHPSNCFCHLKVEQ